MLAIFAYSLGRASNLYIKTLAFPCTRANYVQKAYPGGAGARTNRDGSRFHNITKLEVLAGAALLRQGCLPELARVSNQFDCRKKSVGLFAISTTRAQTAQRI